MIDKERRIVAYHELGHALVALALPGREAIHKVSIIPRGVGALGYTIQRPTEDRFLMTREELDNKIAMLLGGRAAEQLVFGGVSTGAADDLAKATDIARSMVAEFGMDATLDPVSYEAPRTAFLGPASRRAISSESTASPRPKRSTRRKGASSTPDRAAGRAAGVDRGKRALPQCPQQDPLFLEVRRSCHPMM